MSGRCVAEQFVSVIETWAEPAEPIFLCKRTYLAMIQASVFFCAFALPTSILFFFFNFSSPRRVLWLGWLRCWPPLHSYEESICNCILYFSTVHNVGHGQWSYDLMDCSVMVSTLSLLRGWWYRCRPSPSYGFDDRQSNSQTICTTDIFSV